MSQSIDENETSSFEVRIVVISRPKVRILSAWAMMRSWSKGVSLDSSDHEHAIFAPLLLSLTPFFIAQGPALFNMSSVRWSGYCIPNLVHMRKGRETSSADFWLGDEPHEFDSTRNE